MLTKEKLDLHKVRGSTSFGKIGYKYPISMRLNRNEIGVLLGGRKSRQVMHLIMNMGSIEQGEVGFFGNSIKTWHHQDSMVWRRRIGFAFRDMGLLSNLSIFNNVDLPAKYHGYYDKILSTGALGEKALTEIEVPKIYWQRLPIDVPDEIQKKALLARAAVLEPKLLIMDDPAALFSWPQLPKLINWILNQKEKGTACLISTDHYPFGVSLADWVLIPDFGDIDYEFHDHLDPSVIAVADILKTNVERYLSEVVA